MTEKCTVCGYETNSKRGLTIHNNLLIKVYGDKDHILIKNVNYCLYCGKETQNEKYCSKSCGAHSPKHSIGNRGWSKGLTKAMDSRVSKGAKARLGKHPWNYGLTRDKIPWFFEKAGFQCGEKHPLWIFNRDSKYNSRFDDITKSYILDRDNYTCQLCGSGYKVCVHHIDYNKKHSFPSNLITLCIKCNFKVNRDRNYWENYFAKYMVSSKKIKDLELLFVPETGEAIITVVKDY